MATQVLLEPLWRSRRRRIRSAASASTPFFDRRRSSPRRTTATRPRRSTNEVYRLSDNPVLALITNAITSIVSDHVVATMDPVELRADILDEHAALARAIARGHAEQGGPAHGRPLPGPARLLPDATGRRGCKSSSSGADSSGQAALGGVALLDPPDLHALVGDLPRPALAPQHVSVAGDDHDHRVGVVRPSSDATCDR